MNTIIENARTTFFTDKDHYIAFRSSWAEAVNSPNAKSKLIPSDEWLSETDEYSNGTGIMRISGNVTGAHNMLFNILRGRDMMTGFTITTNKHKIEHGQVINEGFHTARARLGGLATNQHSAEKRNKRVVEWVEKFLSIFNGTVTMDMFDKAVGSIPKVVPLYTEYGPGKAIAQSIMNGDGPTCLEDLRDIVFKENK